MNHIPHSKLIAIFVVAAAAVIFVTPGQPQSAPQQAPASTAAPQAPAVRVSTRLVQVNVIAQDGEGKPTLGLTKEDFQITDQGKPQQIAFFSFQQSTTAIVNRAAAAPALPAGMHLFSNRLEERQGVQPNVTVILLDSLNTRAGDMPFARMQIQKFIREEIHPEDRVAVYSMSGRALTILHDFTTDASELIAAVSKDPNNEDFRIGASEPDAPDTGDADFDTSLTASNFMMAEFFMNDRVEKTMLGLKTVADHIRGLPGRKNLVWVSGSFPIDIISGTGQMTFEHPDYHDQIEDTARAMNDANIAIYPVDARGLIANPSPVRSMGVRNPRAAPSTTSLSPADQNFATMNTIAQRTGGRAYYNSNNIHGAVRKAIDDSRVTYVIGFYPDGNWDNKFHEISVKVKKSGVHLDYRRGYYAIPETAPTEKEKERLMTDAIWSPLEATELGLDVEVEPVDNPSGARQLRAKIIVSPGQLRFTHDGDHWTDQLDIVWVIANSKGVALVKIPKMLKMTLPQDAYNTVMRDGVSFLGLMDLTDDATEFRLVVRDAGTGAIGSVIVPVSKFFKPTVKTPAPVK
jgi:VWFA-related protein